MTVGLIGQPAQVGDGGVGGALGTILELGSLVSPAALGVASEVDLLIEALIDGVFAKVIPAGVAVDTGVAIPLVVVSVLGVLLTSSFFCSSSLPFFSVSLTFLVPSRLSPSPAATLARQYSRGFSMT